MSQKTILAQGLILLAVSSSAFAEPKTSLTIYNQDFAVVRQPITLDLKKGRNDIRITDITTHMEPDSVILRDPDGKRDIRILEQNYEPDPVSENTLLSRNEGKTIEFLVKSGDSEERVKGKIIRAPYAPHFSSIGNRDEQYYYRQNAMAQNQQPLIEMDGGLMFGLPGKPIFPALAGDEILKPTLAWVLAADKAGPFDGELSYISDGLTWKADYNIIGPEKGSEVDLIGWVTMENQSGKSFDKCDISLMAGDVNKVVAGAAGEFARDSVSGAKAMQAGASEKPFDEYHLYSLPRPVNLQDRESKQVEFIRASQVTAPSIYIYDGALIDDSRFSAYSGTMRAETIRGDKDFGTQSNPKIWSMREIKNSEENNLGFPLPRGKVRFYRQDSDGKTHLVGENLIDHTAKDETLRIYTGNAFDLVGERRRVTYQLNAQTRTALDESFEIKIRNHKKSKAAIHVKEHLYRGTNWEITDSSRAFKKLDSQTIEFLAEPAAGGEETITYTAHYTW